jgi:hypothetical protein
MFKMIKPVIVILFLATIIGCSGSPSTQKSADARSSVAPGWVFNPHSVYDDSKYVSAVGYSSYRASSEKEALGALVSIFGQSVQGETQAGYSYQQAFGGELFSTQGTQEIESVVQTSFSQDTLIGAEIDDIWFDGDDTYYAIAVMDKQKCGKLYSDLIASNLQVIRTLTAITDEEKNSLIGYGNYHMAAVIADANAAFINVLSVLIPASADVYRREARPGDEYRIESQKIARNIPINVTVNNDYSDRIKGAFSEVFANRGFQTGGEDSPYELQVSVVLAETVLPDNPGKFFRYTVNANLVDKKTLQTLSAYNINGREGSTSLSEAQDRTLRAIEEKISEGYTDKLEEYLIGL